MNWYKKAKLSDIVEFLQKGKKAGIIALSTIIASCPVFADKLYVKLANTQMNPAEYNAQIQTVSVGNVFGNASSMGIGYEKDIGKNCAIALDLSKNSQKVDAVKEEIATGNQIVYGQNTLGCTNVDPIFKYNIQLAKNTSLGIGAGLALTQAYLESQNETDTINSTSMLYGPKFSLDLCQRVGNVYIAAEVSQRTGKQEKLDISGLETALKVGIQFGGEK